MGKIFSHLILCWVITSSLCTGQVYQKNYVEIVNEDKTGEDYRVIPAGDKGVFCLFINAIYQKNAKKKLDFSFMDTHLNKIWENSISIDYSQQLVAHHVGEENLYLLFEKDLARYQVLKIDIYTGSNQFIDYQDIRGFYITDFAVIDSVIFFGGSIKDNPAVIRYDYRNQLSVVCPSINQLKADLLWMGVDQALGIVSVMLKSRQRTNETALYISTFDLQGKLLHNFTLEKSLVYNFLTYRPFLVSQHEMLILGTYGLRDEEKAQGIYAFKVKDGQTEMMRFYDFGYLKHFFHYLDENKRDRLIGKIQSKREKKKIFQLRYHVFVHELSEQNGQLVFSGDVYNPLRDAQNPAMFQTFHTYHWRDAHFRRIHQDLVHNPGIYTPSGLTRDPIDRSRGFVYGYEHLNTFACGFDYQGKLLWDNSFKTKGVEHSSPMEFTNVYADDDTVVFIQADEENVRYKVSSLKSFSDSVTVEPVRYFTEYDKPLFARHGGIIDWYGPNFLVTGMRSLRAPFLPEKEKTVFYIYKLAYQPPFQRKTDLGGVH
jgi:hypothetical protein